MYKVCVQKSQGTTCYIWKPINIDEREGRSVSLDLSITLSDLPFLICIKTDIADLDTDSSVPSLDIYLLVTKVMILFMLYDKMFSLRRACWR